MDLLHDLPVDPIAHAEKSIAVDPMNRRRQGGRDARDQPSILSIEGPARSDHAIAPHAPPRRRMDPINMSRRTGGWVWRM